MKIKTEVKTEDLDVKELKKIFDESVGGSKAYFISKVQQKYPNLNKKGVENFLNSQQFSFRPSLVPSVTVVLFRFSDRWERGEGRLAKPGAGLIQPLCRRDGHGRPG
jgi:hypothetical protein